ncbi:gliding motility-associated C-terminal domain-containing protein [Snuella sedimenti]|uniref:Gliding motility-associated C-terminal domain-containing protein n=1 Tax=Snuella sedimenti TaxID=2798802 RepID=A0A8J7LT67_9FLAO|nr:gliding motility-associated C-terminal domain-containing protein [Snuella sedimenti]MBJ6367971.1 gliding motility-associated C-terminal domain-containing protein [Snuella sedimenti]
MKTINLIVFACFLSLFAKIQAQCNQVETITVCDMTIVDGDGNGSPDGIINLYDEYNVLTGGSISLATGTWFDPGYNFALDESTGDLHLWDLDNASETLTDYQFELVDSSSGCPGGVLISLNVVVGPFSGVAVPTINNSDVNIEICDFGIDPCGSSSNFDLFHAFLSAPTAHANGTWRYEGSSPNFIEINANRYLRVDIPYQPGSPLVDDETFELIYSVPGIASCPSVETRVKVSVIREVFSGAANHYNICETELLAGNYDSDLNLRDDAFLVNEDIEGIWLSNIDPTGQITGPADDVVNLRTIYNDLYQSNQRFGCSTYEFSYFVESRSAICTDKTSTVSFTFFEYLRPFQQDGSAPEFCVDAPSTPSGLDLNSLLEFTTENGVLYRYPPKSIFGTQVTSWQLVSGPSDLNLDDYWGTINLSNITNAHAGTYVFRYTVSAGYHCPTFDPNFRQETIHAVPDGCIANYNNNHPCQSRMAEVSIVIHPKNYAGEDTSGLTFCEDNPIIASPLDLFTLLDTNGVDDPIYQGPMGTWTDNATGNVIADPTAFTLPTINDQHLFDFTYTTTTVNGCEDTANLTFTVYEAYQAGVGTTIDVCNTNATIDLFDSLTGAPNTTGTWIGANGYTTTDHHATFNPATSEAGTYTYTVPDNVLCTGNQTTVTVVLHQSPDAGSDMQGAVCRSDLQIDLTNYLDATADSGGVFVDLDATNVLSGNSLDVSQLTAGTYRFEYQIQGHASCDLATAIIAITVEEVAMPVTANQTFCTSDGATVADLEASGAQDYNWYATVDALETLPFGEVLVDGEDYYVAAVDSNGCESQRVSMLVTLLPLDHVDCDDCIKDGISVNGDNQNDAFDLCNLPVAFPNFEINIYNRYGNIVYKGNKSTEYFNGVSNVSLTLGKALPSGVYFYVFDPKDGKTSPFQGNFYLSR